MNTIEPKNWVKLYADYLFRFAQFRIKDEILCEDLVQETFLSALKAKDQFKGNSSEKTWLTSILKNKIIDEYRKNSSKLPIQYFDDEENNSYDIFFNKENNDYTHWNKNQMPKEWSPSSVDGMIHKEYLEVLRQCIGKLSTLHSSILQEKYFEENSSDKICKEFNISKSNYWTTIHRINLSLRKCIELNWFSS